MPEKKLKAGWQRVKFGDVVRQSKEKADPATSGMKRYIGGEHMDTDDLRLRRWGEIGTGYLGPAFHMRFKPGQVLYGSRRTYLRKVALAHFDGICANTTFVLESKDPHVLLPEFLPFLMQTEAFHAYSIKNSKGSVNPYINYSDLAKFGFGLPPKAEQNRILNLLLACHAAIDANQHLIATCELLINTRENYLFAKNSELSFSPLGSLIDFATDGPFGSKLKTEHYADKGARVIRLNNIARHEFDDTDTAFVAESYFQELKNYAVNAGDIIIAGLGDDRIPMGRACIVPANIGPAINKADCFCLRTNEKLSARYLVHFLNSAVGLQQARSLAQGTTRMRLNLLNIRRFAIPIRKLEDQNAIADELDTLRSAKKQALNRLEFTLKIRNRMREVAFFGDGNV